MSAKISVGSSAFAIGSYKDDPIPFDDVIRRLSEVGYEGIELFGDKPYGHPDDYPTKADRRALHAKLADHSLEISNYGADFWGIPLGESDAKARQYQDAFKRNLEFAIDVGAHSIRVDTVTGAYPDGDRAAIWRRYVSTWRNCARLAADARVDIFWEFEPGFIINKPSEITRLVDEIGEPNFKLMFDTCHAQMSGVKGARQDGKKETVASVADFVRLAGGRIGTVHLVDSDNTLHHDETSTHAPFGEGVLDFDAIMKALLAVGYGGPWWTIDLCFWPTAWDIVAPSHRFVRELLERRGLRRPPGAAS
ncbi:MAG: sugar phosphate isomerase/epimerase family protein [Roseiarcus sp.]